jgi:hypothetical protein
MVEQLPKSAGLERGVRFQVVDFIRPTAVSAAATAGGAASVQFAEVPADYYWEIERVIVQSTSPAASTVEIFAGDPTTTRNLQDSSTVGNLAAAGYPEKMRLFPGEQLNVVWAGCTAGAICEATLQVSVVKRVFVGG